MPQRVKIAVIDDHRIFLDGISLLVSNMEEHFDVTGFNAPADLLKYFETDQHFDLVICDLIMNAMNGLAFVAALRAKSKSVPILMLSGINYTPPIEQVKTLGGNGFVHKSADNDCLETAIKTVLSGGSYFTDGLGDTENIQTSPSETAIDDELLDTPALPKLAPRQIEVLKLMADGSTNKDISDILGISENTVKTHLKQIFMELGANKRTACVRKAQTLGLI